MKYNTLGKSEIRVSELAFGCMSLGADYNKNEALLHRAYQDGVNFFDTADLYAKGENEVALGKAFAGRRDKVIIATKVGNQLRPDGNGWDWNPTKAYILKSAEESLRRLQTDYIDLYQLHGGTIDDPIDETIDAFELLKKQGKIRAYGISSIRPNVIREYVKRSHIDSVMMQYSLLDRRPEETCLSLLKQNTISVLVRGALAQGLLLHKPAVPYLNYPVEGVARMKEIIRQLNDRTATEIAIGYVLQNEPVASVVAGIRNEIQWKDINDVFPIRAFSTSELSLLTNALVPGKYEHHR